MSEEQEKPRHTWHKQAIFQWFFVVLVLCVIAGIIVMGVGGQYGPFYSPNCNGAVWVIESDIIYYSAYHNGSMPVLNGSYSNANCSSCHVINMSAVLSCGSLWAVPEDTWQGPGADDDNCDSQDGAITGCSASNNYIWIVDANGSVYSYCIGIDCQTNNSGYQGLLPWMMCD
ncbi:MAG: hypothetical protein WC562_02530 [Dehalococcoidia bacterium]